MHSVARLLGTLAVAASLAVTVVAGTALAAPPSVGLGTAGGFAVLAGETITNTGPTTITGNVGLHPGSAVTGFASVTLHGAQHVADGVALKAKNDLVTAYNDAAGRTPVTTVATELGGKSLKAGVYNSAAGTFGVTGTLTLDAEGDSHAVFIFKAASTLITAPGSSVALINGASACNVFWQVGSSATLDTTTKFKGTVMALTSISLKTGATLQGRALARNGAVTLDSNVITDAACATTIPNTAMPRGGGPLAMAVPMSLLLIGLLAVLMSGALLGLRSVDRRR
jgi:Ice-binding-like